MEVELDTWNYNLDRTGTDERLSVSLSNNQYRKGLVMLLLSVMMENELKPTKTSCVEEVLAVKRINSS